MTSTLSFTLWFEVLCGRKLLDCLRYRNTTKYNITVPIDIEEHALLHNIPDLYLASSLDAIIMNEKLEQIDTILCEMPIKKRRQRIAWILIRLEGYTYKQVSAIMKATVGAVKVMVLRCSEYLKEVLQEEQFQ